MQIKTWDSGAYYAQFTRSEGELIGLYDGPAVDGKRRNKVDRGLGTSHPDQADVIGTMLETALEFAAAKPGALQFLRDMLRDKAGTFTLAMGLALWLEAQTKVGKNAENQLEYILKARSSIKLAPLVEQWNGGNGAPEQRARNKAKLRRFIPVDSPLTADQFTARRITDYLHGLLKSETRYEGQTMTKRAMLKHRYVISLFAAWLMTPTAASAAGLGEEADCVLLYNPVDRIIDADITKVPADEDVWAENRVHYTLKESKQIVMKATGELRAFLALLFGSMVELGGVYNTDHKKAAVGPTLFKRNFLRDEQGNFTRWFHVGGLRNRDRNLPKLKKGSRRGNGETSRTRDIEIPDAEGYGFFWGIVHAHLLTLKEDDPFISKEIRYYQRHFDMLLGELGLARMPGRLFHPTRHSFAEFWIKKVSPDRKDGRDLAWLKQQAGHGPRSVVLMTVYVGNQREDGKGTQHVSDERSQQERGIKRLALA